MEDALKARLIGATVLVGLAVLLIPELLSGRKPAEQATAQAGASRGTRTFTIELGATPGNSVLTEDASKPAPAPAPPSQPVPRQASEPGAGAAVEAAGAATDVQSTGESTESSPQPASAALVVEPAPEAVARPAAESKPAESAPAESAPAESAPAQIVPARGGWAVQVGAFGSAEAANKLVGQLRSADFAAYVAPVSRSGRTLHRVRVGPVTARAGAEALVPALKARGLPATVVAND
jgi:cell division septation protein DedD